MWKALIIVIAVLSASCDIPLQESENDIDKIMQKPIVYFNITLDDISAIDSLQIDLLRNDNIIDNIRLNDVVSDSLSFVFKPVTGNNYSISVNTFIQEKSHNNKTPSFSLNKYEELYVYMELYIHDNSVYAYE